MPSKRNFGKAAFFATKDEVEHPSWWDARDAQLGISASTHAVCAPSWPPGKAGICVPVGSSDERLVADWLHRAAALAIAVLGRGGGVALHDV